MAVGRSHELRRNRAIVLRDNPPCAHQCLGICTGKATVVDHIIPKSRGGSDDITNLLPSCYPCNDRRRNMEIGAFRRKYPSRPDTSGEW